MEVIEANMATMTTPKVEDTEMVDRVDQNLDTRFTELTHTLSGLTPSQPRVKTKP